MFKVGDIVTGKKGNGYGYDITTSEAIMEVVAVYDDERMKVKMLEHTKYPEEVGEEYIVCQKYFELVKKEPQSTMLEEMVNNYNDWIIPKMTVLEMIQESKEKPMFKIPLPHLTTTDGKKQRLSYKDGVFFASRKSKKLKQTFTLDELMTIVPQEYRGFATLL